GDTQVAWLEEALKNSKATWKVISADMPLGLNISDDYVNSPPQRWEGVSNGNDGPAAGRELELARLLSFIKHNHINNVVWLTADVHYAAAHYYDPEKAASDDFLPFWEFISGPLNAGSFGPNSTDGTFGPQVEFYMAPPQGQANLSPYAGLQFFGEVNIDSTTADMTVELKDINGDVVFSKILEAQKGKRKAHYK
ncbi:MAG: alkaline phosphatase D family protein, partial [Gammaproteobacteria bacterium]|nr:alkaline phosphatase D family protein [Gammaproteobacteria bacterium]